MPLSRTRSDRPAAASEPAPAARAPSEPARPALEEPQRYEASPVEEPSEPIVKSAGHAAPAQPTTFGQLLERTLALRPR
jgi:hypothetical protein